MDLEHLEMDFKLSKTKFKRDFPDFPIRRITFSDFFVEEEDLDSAADDDDDEEGDNLYDKERDELEPFTTFQEEALARHNKYRKRHGVRDLILDHKLCDLAQSWAEYLIDNNTFKHRPDNDFGENIWTYRSSNPEKTAKKKGSAAVDSWYDEVEQYSFNSAGTRRQPGTGHFTQVVWSSSRRLGVGLAIRGGKMIVVANYDPPGNYNNMYKQNVFPPI